MTKLSERGRICGSRARAGLRAASDAQGRTEHAARAAHPRSCRKPNGPQAHRGDIGFDEDGRLSPQKPLCPTRADSRLRKICRGRVESRAHGKIVLPPARQRKGMTPTGPAVCPYTAKGPQTMRAAPKPARNPKCEACLYRENYCPIYFLRQNVPTSRGHLGKRLRLNEHFYQLFDTTQYATMETTENILPVPPVSIKFSDSRLGPSDFGSNAPRDRHKPPVC